MKIISDWFRSALSDPQAVVLTVVLVTGTLVVLFLGKMLAPVFAGIVIAYLLEGLVRPFERRGMPRIAAVLVVYALFTAAVLFLALWVLPLLWGQLTQLIQQLPAILLQGQELLLGLPEAYPRIISEEQVLQVIASLRSEIGGLGQNVLSWSLASVVGLITIAIYFVLVPMLVFFFLKDKTRLVVWFQRFLPEDHTLSVMVWREVDLQIGNYVRGKFWEVVVVWAACAAAFVTLGLQFAVLLALMVGLSVIVPYIGAVIVTLPVAVVAFFQWGWGNEFLWLMGAYAVIQAIDGNVLVPLLFSEVVDLHPIAIIVAVLLFGGLWGGWGVFFAIPLATLVQAVLKSWPRAMRDAAADHGGAAA